MILIEDHRCDPNEDHNGGRAMTLTEVDEWSDDVTDQWADW